ncbi:GNAT family N-acetyltransferase [Bordetella bronchialis]|uniref:GNAT family N-acetyltransferase n=1 Tax=Bordetella bronchialis TaxID=463025 RepID=UPI0009F429F6
MTTPYPEGGGPPAAAPFSGKESGTPAGSRAPAATSSAGTPPGHATIALEPPRQDDVQALLAQADAYLHALYPPESNHILEVDALEQPGIDFFVARRAGIALGCCALVPALDGSAEIKRMFVVPEARGMRLGRRLLERLEDQARARGIPLLRLETGIHQPEALGLYRASGYRDIPPFGDYLPDPLSVFMEKVLDARR